MKKILGILVLSLFWFSPSLSNEKYKNIVEPIFCANDLGAIDENTVTIIGNGLYYNCNYNKLSHSQVINVQLKENPHLSYLNEKGNHLNLCFNIKSQRIFKTLNPFTGSCPNYLVKLLYDSNYYFYYGKKLKNLDKLDKSYLLVKKDAEGNERIRQAKVAEKINKASEINNRDLELIKGLTTNGNEFIFDNIAQTINERTIVPSYLKGSREVEDLYYMSEFSPNEVIAEISYSLFAYRLGKTYGGKKRFYRKYKKEITESKKNCNCEDPIYKTFLLDLKSKHAYKIFHPQSNKPKLIGDFRLKKNIGHSIVSSSVASAKQVGDTLLPMITSETAENLINAYMIYSAIENPQGIFKKNKGSSSTSSSSTVTKSLGSGSGSGSVLDREFGGQSLKRLIAISRR